MTHLLINMTLVIFLKLLFSLVTEGSLVDGSNSSSINLGTSLTTDTNSSWLSPSGLFAFGFYKQDNGFAVGIWLTTKPEITVVWTANRDDPPLSSNSTIELSKDGWLLLHTTAYGSQNLTRGRSVPATSASMFDSGIFVLYNDSVVVWKSFDYPSDTILGGQELRAGRQLVSSVSAFQHSSGRFLLYMQPDGNLVAYPLDSSQEDEDSYWSSGTFYSGFPFFNLSCRLNGSLMVGYGERQKVLSSPTSSTQSRNINETVVFRATLNPDGNFGLYSYIFTTPSSNVTRMRTEWLALQDPCQAKGICGVNSYCSSTTSGHVECHCFPGFLFVNSTRNVSCYRNFTDEEACGQRGPLKLSYNITAVENMELGVSPYSVTNLGEEACSKSCLEDCNCWVGVYVNGSCKLIKAPVIYAFRNISKIATVFVKTSYQTVENLYMNPLPAPTNLKQSVVIERKKLVRVIAITLGFLALMCTVMAFSSFCYYRVHARRYQNISRNVVDFELISDHSTLRSFSYNELQQATDGFKEVIASNSISEVYKGFIYEGKKAVAVKKLHKMMFEGGGGGGFRAEITAIAQTHHRNLVRLLGFCIHGATKILVYEFMSNGSLADLLLTQPPAFKERVRVALDVARGILYLHEECETRIIHCNIKPRNILFDESWTAKISDFGLSKLLRPNQSESTITGVRGTRGYLAPEWLKNASITTKVDIYSFGVVLLEILCCTCRYTEIRGMPSDDITPLSTWVYDCFVAKELNRLIGDDHEDEVDIDMLERMAKVGLLCIQDNQDARPSIKDVILMLEGTTDIPIPQSPTPPSLI